MKGKTIITGLLAIILVLAALTPATSQPVSGKEYYNPVEVGRKVRDLESLNLLKGLNLSPAQMKELLTMLYEADLLEREVFIGYKQESKNAIKMLEMLEKKIMDDKGINVATEEKVWFALGTLYEYEYDQYMVTDKMVEKVRKMLNKNQLRIISDYMPCVIPWESVKPTGRIGQSGSIDKLVKLMDHLRSLNGEKYQKAKRNFLVELDWRLRIDRHEDDKTRQILVREIDAKIDEIHRMKVEEYEIRKTDLVQSIRPPDLEILPPRVGEELNEYIVEYILNPHNIKYIQYRLDKEGVKYPKPDDIIDKDIDEDVD